MVILAVDYGTKNIGLAHSPDGVFAFAMGSIANYGPEKTLSEITEIISDKKVGLVIVGYPMTDSEMETTSACLAREFAEAIHLETGVEVELVDESFSSVEARSVGHELGKNDKNMRDSKDSVEAQIILMRYLESLQ